MDKNKYKDKIISLYRCIPYLLSRWDVKNQKYYTYLPYLSSLYPSLWNKDHTQTVANVEALDIQELKTLSIVALTEIDERITVLTSLKGRVSSLLSAAQAIESINDLERFEYSNLHY